MRDAFQLAPAQWSTLRSLLGTALDLPASARADWIERLDTQFDPFKPQLRALLAHADDGATARLMATLPKVETDQFAPAADRAQEAAVAERVGPYRLVRELGRGGMASVWLAERTDMLQGRQVALKLPHGAWRRAGLAERMQREREILATLHHPNIATLFDAGVDADGQPWLALEYVEGEPIDAYCNRHRLDIAARLRLFLQVAHAVAHAHANLVVHRDLKPSNILVNAAGEVRLLDFGIAKIIEDGLVRETELTQASGRALTPDYASPEQILGQPVSTASDVYALGVVLFELLTGERPYRPRRDSRAALEDAIVQTDAPRPSAIVADPRTRKRLRGDLDTIALKALKKDPRARYATVNALAEDVERYLTQRPVLAQPDTRGYRLRKFVLRNRVAVAAASGVMLAVLAGASVAVWQARIANEQRDAAVREQRRAEEVKSFMLSLFRDANPQNRPGHALSAVELLMLAKDRVGSIDPARVELRVELLGTLGDALLILDEAKTAQSVLMQAVDEAQSKLGPEHKMTLWTKSMLSQAYRRQSLYPQMRSMLEDILPVLQRRQQEFPNQYLAALVNLANLSCTEMRMDECRAAVEEGLRISDTRFGGRHANTSLLLSRQARLLSDIGAHDRALAVAAQGVALAMSLHEGKPGHAMVLNARFSQARARAEAGQMQAALAEFNAILADTAQSLGPNTRTYGLRLTETAPWFARAGQFDRALAMADGAIAILARTPDEDLAAAADAHLARAQILLAQRRPAVEAMERALGIAVRTLPADHAALRSMRHDLALAQARAGRIDAALATLDATPLPDLAQAPTIAVRAAFARATVLRLAGRPAQAAGTLIELERQLSAAGLSIAPAERQRASIEAQLAGLPVPTVLAWIAPPSDTPPTCPDDADALIAQARAAIAAGNAGAALRAAERADTYWLSADANSPWAGEAAYWQARAYAALGQTGEARRQGARAARLLRATTVPEHRAWQREVMAR